MTITEARIYRPTRNTMQSGTRNTEKWVLEFYPKERRFIDPLMGWTGSEDTSQQLRLYFATEAQARDYATRAGISYRVIPPKPLKRHIRSYADNFK